MKTVISPAAIGDLEDIWLYSAANCGAAQADSYIDTVMARIEWLTLHRLLWRSRDDLRQGLFAQREAQHLIVFRERSTALEIVRILHVSMDAALHI